jgi:hypothetical protein
VDQTAKSEVGKGPCLGWKGFSTQQLQGVTIRLLSTILVRTISMPLSQFGIGWCFETARYKETNAMLTGGCFCGWIRYEAANPFDETNCHCSICRRTTGAPFIAWFSVPRPRFRFLSGRPTRFQSTQKGARSFCPRCGTQLTFEHDDFPDEIDVTTCSLDDPDSLPPRDHTHMSSKLRWIKLCDQLPEYPEGRPQA